MAQLSYLDFDLVIERAPEGGYRARVLKSPAGQASISFTQPIGEQDLKILVLTLRGGGTRRGGLKPESDELKSLKKAGGDLFDAVFAGPVGNLLYSSLENAERTDKGLRIRLWLGDTPELMPLPWEYLYSRLKNRFIARSIFSPIVRFIELPEYIRPLTVAPPVRVLALIAKPSDYEELDAEKEWNNLNTALGTLIQNEQVELHRVQPATLDALRRQLRLNQYHIFHFIGHGDFDPHAEMGGLVMEDERQRGILESAQEVGEVLHDHRSLRLALLNACRGARSSHNDPFAGVAQNLVRQGIPAVIAMQFEISDSAAVTFSQEFYTALTDGYPVDAALTEARKAIYTKGNELEWGTPVLYSRAPDGVIFELAASSADDRRAAQVRRLVSEAQSAYKRQDWETALERVRAAVALDANSAEAIVLERNILREQEWGALYAEGKAHFQAGHWRPAYETLARLRNLKPNYQDVEALMASAQRELARESKDKQRRARIEQLTAEGTAALAKRDWATALQKAQAMLVLDATNSQAAALSSQAQQGQELDALYATARQHYEAKHWRETIEYIQRIKTMGGAYPGVDGWLKIAQREFARQSTVPQTAARPPVQAETGVTTPPLARPEKKGRGVLGGVSLLVIGGVVGVALVLCLCVLIANALSDAAVSPPIFTPPQGAQTNVCYTQVNFCYLAVYTSPGTPCTCTDSLTGVTYSGLTR